MIHTMTSSLSTAPSKIAVDLRLSLHSLTLSLLRRELRVHTISARIQRISLRRKTRLKILESHELILDRGDDVRTSNPRDSRAWRKYQQAHKARCRDANEPCAWCGRPIDYDLPPSHGKAFTSDHIEELQHGGDVLGELAPFHRGCNSEKGNGRKKPALGVRSSRAW